MIDEKIKSLGIELPIPPTPAGSYIPVVTSQKFAFVSGQIPMVEGKMVHTGKVTELNIEEGQKSAKLCAINILAQLKREFSTLDKISRIVKVTGYVNCGPDFTMQPKVINGASDFLFDVFGEKGKHARVAIGVSSLPLDAMTEVDAIVEIQ